MSRPQPLSRWPALRQTHLGVGEGPTTPRTIQGVVDPLLEAIVIAIVTLAPWAYGAREPWALLWIAAAVALLAILFAATLPQRSNAEVRAFGLPGTLILGLAVLGLFQLVPWSEPALQTLDPTLAALHRKLIPDQPEQLADDRIQATIKLPSRTLSQDPDATFGSVVNLLDIWVVFIVVSTLAQREGALERFCIALTVSACLVAIESVFQQITWEGKIYGVRASPWGSAGPFYNKNHLAAFLNLGLAANFGLLANALRDRDRADKRRGMNLLFAYPTAMILLGLILSMSRGGFLAALLIVIASTFAFRVRSSRTFSAKEFIGNFQALAITAATVIVSLVMVGGAVDYSSRLATLLHTSAYAPRFQVWRAVLSAWPRHPIWGTGLGTFANASQRFLTSDTNEVYQHAENEYVEWLFEGGIVGFALWTVGILTVLCLGIRFVRRERFDSTVRSLAIASLLGILAVAIQSASDFGIRTAAIAIPVVVLGGFLNGLQSLGPTPCSQTGRPIRRPLSKAKIALLSTGLGMASTLSVVHYNRLEAAEHALSRAGLTIQDRYERISRNDPVWPKASDDQIELIDEALGERPDWADGYLLKGRVLLALYESETERVLEGSIADRNERTLFANPLWLHSQIHDESRLDQAGGSLANELSEEGMIGRYLVPALRSFLEARRCSPYLAQPHVEIGLLDPLMVRGDRSETYERRGAVLAGSNRATLERIALIACQCGDVDLAADCWRRSLSATDPAADAGWLSIADLAATVLPPEPLLERVVPDGPYAVLFAEHFFDGLNETSQAYRARFLNEAIRRLDDAGRKQGRSPTLAERNWKARAERDLRKNGREFGSAGAGSGASPPSTSYSSYQSVGDRRMIDSDVSSKE